MKKCLLGKIGVALFITFILSLNSMAFSEDKVESKKDNFFIKYEQRLNDVEKEMHRYSDLLQVQSNMYNINITVILAIFLFFAGLTYLYNFKAARRHVAESLSQFKQDLEKSSEKIKQDSLVSAGKLFEDYSKKFEAKIENLKGHHYDALGRLYFGQKDYGVAFVWYIRAYGALYESTSKEFLNILLERIVECLDEMTYISSDDMAETSKIIPLISDQLDGPRKEYIIKKIGKLSTPKEEKAVE